MSNLRGFALSATFLAGLLSCGDAKPPPAGRVLYLRHCAACHGESGDGLGPVAAGLRRPPSDLRTLRRRHGAFDESYVMSFIDGRRSVVEHGPREMPVWGAVFEAERSGQRHGAYGSLLHSRALTDHLRGIQID